MGKVVGDIVALQENVSLILEEIGQDQGSFVAVGGSEPNKVLVLGHHLAKHSIFCHPG